MKSLFVINPKSGGGNTGKRWGKLGAIIARKLSDFGVVFTRAPGEAQSLTRDALESGYDCVVAVGGDGTINDVVNGFFRDGAVINPTAALGILPRGTGSDFRRTFDWNTDFEAAVDRLKNPDTRPLDVGKATFLGHDGVSQTRYFVNVLSFGISGLVDENVNATSKALGGRLSFAYATLKSLLQYSDQRVRLRFDNGTEREVPVTALAVANGKYFGGGMKVAPEADVSDGLLDVTIWSGYRLADFVLRSDAVYSGSHVTWDRTTTLRAKEVIAESDERVLIDCDGEQPGTLPLRVKILPGAIRLKV